MFLIIKLVFYFLAVNNIMLENFKKFLQFREIINMDEEISKEHQETRYLRELIKRELKLVHLFEKKMTEDKITIEKLMKLENIIRDISKI